MKVGSYCRAQYRLVLFITTRLRKVCKLFALKNAGGMATLLFFQGFRRLFRTSGVFAYYK